MGFKVLVWDLRFGIKGSGFGVWGLGVKVEGLEFWVEGLGLGVRAQNGDSSFISHWRHHGHVVSQPYSSLPPL